MNTYLIALYHYLKLSSAVTTSSGKSRTYMTISQKIIKQSIFVYFVFVFPIFLALCIFHMPGVITSTALNILLNIIGITASILVIFMKRTIYSAKHKYKPTNFDIYKRDLPSKLRPLHVRMLLNDGIIDEFSMSCTILDLVNRGYLRLETEDDINNVKNNIFLQKNVTTIYLIDKPQDDLFMYESYLINWFIKDLGDGQKVTNKELKEKLNSASNHDMSSNNFGHFQALALASFPLSKYYNNTNSYISRLLNFGLVMISPLAFPHGLNFIFLFLYSLGLGNILWGCPNHYINKTGIEEKDQWLDLKRYLIDFSDMKNKNIDLLPIWDYYLTYSVALDVPSIAKEQITDFFGEYIFYSNNSALYGNCPNVIGEIKQWISQEKEKYDKLLN